MSAQDASNDPRGQEIDDNFISERTYLGADLAKKSVQEFPDDFGAGPEFIKSISNLTDADRQKSYRAIRKMHRGSNGSTSTKVEDVNLDGYGMFGVATPPYNIEYLSQLYTKSAPHYSAVNAKVANIVLLGHEIVDSHKAKEMIEEAETQEQRRRIQRKISKARTALFEWIDACNEEDTFEEVMKSVVTDYEATGNGYFEIGRDINGEIGYIGHIPSKTMRVRKERDGFVQIIGNKVRFYRHIGASNPNPVTDDSRPNEVIHIKKYSPDNSYYGVPDIMAALTAVTGNEIAARYNLDYFENKAVPRYVVVIKGGKIGIQGHREILNFFDSAVKGSNHRTILVPLPGDDGTSGKTSFEMKPVEAGVQDASFVNYYKTNLQTILMAERVPMTKVGMAEGVNIAVARDADKTFKEQVVRPEQKIIEKKLNKIFKEKSDILNFRINELTLTDEDTQSKIDERYLRMQVIVPNEVRARWGKTGIDGGDKVVDLKNAGAEAAAKNNRQRDAERSASSSDSAGEARNAKGDGRATE